MSLTVFLALCVVGIDFLIYALFQWTYGDKRSAIARQVAVQRNALKEQSHRPFLVTSQRPFVAPSEVRGEDIGVFEAAKLGANGNALSNREERVRWFSSELSSTSAVINDLYKQPS